MSGLRCQSHHSRAAIWIEAATGMATRAPRTPRSVAPKSTETITTNGWTCTVRAWICGWMNVFSTCW